MPDTSQKLETQSDDSIVLGVPLSAVHGATLRVIITSLGADAGFSIDEIDDLKLAVSEVFALLLENGRGGAPGRAQLHAVAAAGSLEVRMSSDRHSGELELDALATTILSSVVDEFAVTASGVRLVKRSAESAH